jgi:RNA ligase (TIGR02306 family)
LPAHAPIEEDADVTEVMEIVKYEPPIPANLAGKAKGLFPSFIPKTDETRVQVLQDLLDKYAGEACYITEKLDGSSVTYYMRNGVFGVCSRNLELLEDDTNSMWKVAREMDLEEKLKSLGKNFAIQGEIIGEGIQSNKFKLREQTVRFFNAFEIDIYNFLDFEAFKALFESWGLLTVPILDENYALSNDINTLVSLATRKSVVLPEVWAEGIVIRPLREKTDTIGRVSFKAINPEFLLKYGD